VMDRSSFTSPRCSSPSHPSPYLWRADGRTSSSRRRTLRWTAAARATATAD
jgi:hypothetical protein